MICSTTPCYVWRSYNVLLLLLENFCRHVIVRSIVFWLSVCTVKSCQPHLLVISQSVSVLAALVWKRFFISLVFWLFVERKTLWIWLCTCIWFCSWQPILNLYIRSTFHSQLLGCISFLLVRLSKLPSTFKEHWLGNLGNLDSSKEIQSYLATSEN